MRLLSAWFGVCLVALSADRAIAQVVNGDFSAGGTGWTSTIPAGSSLTYTGGQLVTVSDNNGGANSRTYASQSLTTTDPGYLTWLLASYTSVDQDLGAFDYPMVLLGGTFYWVNLAGGIQTTATGAVDNDDTGLSNLTVRTTLTPGTRIVGAGVTSQDSCCGAGTARWDNIVFQELTRSPPAQTVDEDVTLTMTGANAPQVATNSGVASMSVTLSVANGTLSLASTTGLTVTGNGTATVTLTGSPVSINTAMNGLVYTPAADFNGGDTLTFTTTAGTLTDTDLIAITVNPVPDPALTITKSATFITGTAPASVGDVVRYTYEVTNTGDTAILDVQVTDVHNGTGAFPANPGNAVLTDAAPTGDSPDTNGDATIWGTLAPGDTVTFTADYTVTQTDVDTLQ